MDAVQEVKSRINIEDVVSEYVQLKRAGRNFKGLSPFTNEKTPSFIVSPEKQIWHDFSSGRGGDVFSFIMEVEGVDFKGSLDLLARKSGVDLDAFKNSSTGKKGENKERLLETLQLATKFYQVQLAANTEAISYLGKDRKFTKKTILDFQLGYSPNNGAALVDFLRKKGFKDTEIKSSGLGVIRSGRMVDMFRGRIMVPLCDGFGRPVGFTARLLEDDGQSPKYINTPATNLYDKSRHVYGLHLAKKSIRDAGFSVIVEGNLDVVASHQAEQKNVVASAGTAMTEYQLKSLSRLAPEVRLAFDQDQAGLAATERAIPIASKVGVDLQIITIPSGKDPDDLIKKDPALWQKAIDSPKPAFDWLVERYRDKLDLKTAAGKRTFSDVLLSIVRQLKDQVEQDHYLKQISSVSGIDLDALKNKLGDSKEKNIRLKYVRPKTKEIDDKFLNEWQKAIDGLMCLALMMPGTRGYLDVLDDKMLPGRNPSLMLDFLRNNPDFDGDMKQIVAFGKKDNKKAEQEDDKSSGVHSFEDYVKVLSLQFEELYGNVDTLELQFEAARLRAKIIEYFVKQAKISISKQLEQATDSQEKDLLEKSRQLDELLRRVKK